jgi:hypothetical protein
LSTDPALQISLADAAQAQLSTDTTQATAKERVQNNIAKLSELRLPIGVGLGYKCWEFSYA